MNDIPKLVDVASVRPLPGHRSVMTFSAEGVTDLSWVLSADGPLVQPLKDEAFFAQVFVEMGAPILGSAFCFAFFAIGFP